MLLCLHYAGIAKIKQAHVAISSVQSFKKDPNDFKMSRFSLTVMYHLEIQPVYHATFFGCMSTMEKW